MNNKVVQYKANQQQLSPAQVFQRMGRGQGIVNHSPDAGPHRQLQRRGNAGPQAQKIAQLQAVANGYPQGQNLVQLQADRSLQTQKAAQLHALANGYAQQQNGAVSKPEQTIQLMSRGPIQLAKTDHEEGDLHYGIHAARIDGYGAMPAGAGVVHAGGSAENPVTVDQLNALSGITNTFDRADGDYMRGYFDVMAMLAGHATVGAGGTRPQRWLDFLKANMAYLSIDKHIAQIQSPGATAGDPTKDRLNKNGLPPGLGETHDGKRDAIVAAHALQQRDPAHAAYDGHVSAWMWDVFFRRTSKLGIKFAAEENHVIHMNNFAPAWGGGANPASTITADAVPAAHARLPITHSEMRYINRNYGPDHANIDMYHKDSDAGGPITRPANVGHMDAYANARATRIQTAFLNAVLTKTQLPGWNAITGSIFRSRPTGVNAIRNELRSTHTNAMKLTRIMAMALARTGAARGRHARTRAFYQLISEIPANIHLYLQPGTTAEVNNAITNSLKALLPRVNAFAI